MDPNRRPTLTPADSLRAAPPQRQARAKAAGLLSGLPFARQKDRR